MKVQNVKNSTVDRLRKGEFVEKNQVCSTTLASDLASDLYEMRKERDHLKKLLREHMADVAKDAKGLNSYNKEVKEYACQILDRWQERAAYHKAHCAVADVDELSTAATNDAKADYQARFL